MAFDGAFISQLVKEINSVAIDSRIDKIHQPSREEIIIALRTKQGNYKLLLSASASNPRFHFTNIQTENPKSPPMFCMLLRKHISSGRFIEAKQIGLDRIVHFVFETTNEFGDKVNVTIATEIMGRHSNIILFDQNGKVIDSIKRIDDDMSSVRQVLPGMTYTLPPAQNKINILSDTNVVDVVSNSKRDIDLSKALIENLSGLSPLICREIANFSTHGVSKTVSELTNDNKERLAFFVSNLSDDLNQGKTVPTVLVDKSGKPTDFSFMEIKQYDNLYKQLSYESYSLLLDSYFGERDAIERMKQRSNDLLKLLANLSERTIRRVNTQREELKESGNREQLKIYGDIISSNMYSLTKGLSNASLANFYDENSPIISIPLDIMLTPAQNAQKYYSEYRKASNAEKKLLELISSGEEEIKYLDTVFGSLVRTRTEGELEAIRLELSSVGYIKNYNAKYKKPEKLSAIRYQSSDGFTILSGRNNIQNDQLTLKDAKNYDMWFHTQKIPGSHTIVISDGKDIPNRTLEEAAIIAAFNSQARDSSKVPVDYTIIKNVKKPSGAKPGMVIYETYQTAIVDPNYELVKSLLVK
ncbi:MAG: NFACT RNA binding domain-containing protein [Oscillospiraceae bacterium]